MLRCLRFQVERAGFRLKRAVHSEIKLRQGDIRFKSSAREALKNNGGGGTSRTFKTVIGVALDRTQRVNTGVTGGLINDQFI